jgi:hypothetical protein
VAVIVREIDTTMTATNDAHDQDRGSRMPLRLRMDQVAGQGDDETALTMIMMTLVGANEDPMDTAQIVMAEEV